MNDIYLRTVSVPEHISKFKEVYYVWLKLLFNRDCTIDVVKLKISD